VSLSVWRAVGDFVLLTKDDGKSNSGLIIDAPHIITSIGEFVPTDLTEGVSVVLCDDAELTHIEPSNPNSPFVVHYTKICAASFDGAEVVPMVHLRGF
jgi:hypothetical protein